MNISNVSIRSKVCTALTSDLGEIEVKRRVLLFAATSLLALICLHFPTTASAACIEEGGNEFCRAPLVSDWDVAYCPMMGAFTSADIAQCRASGGTWNGLGNPCTGATPLTEANLTQQVTAFSQILNNDNPSCGIAADSGWGQTLPENILCWTGPPYSQNNMLISDRRIFTMSCWPTVYARKDRSLSCPTGYFSSTLPNGDMVCKRAIECTSGCVGQASTTGHPITHGTGLKALNETDYQLSGGGVSFTRYYNSMYFFTPRAAAGEETRQMGRNWRNNFSKRIYPVTGSAFVSAAMTHPTGEVQYYDAAGNEVINYGKSKTRLLTTSEGYQLVKPDDSTEFYDSSGKLLSVRALSGVTQTMVYSDGTDGSQTGLGGYMLDASGNPTTFVMPADWLYQVVDSFGRTLTFGYDNYGRIVKVIVPGGNHLLYTYDSNANITQVTQTDGSTRQYLYNEPGYRATSLPNALTGIIDENGVRYASYYYDSSGRAIRELLPSAGANTNEQLLSYNSATQTTTVTDALGAVRTYQFQLNNVGLLQLVSTTQPAPSGSGTVTSTMAYDVNGNVASRTDFKGNVTQYTHDLSRNLEISRTEAYGTSKARTITTQWHPDFRLPLLITEPNRTTSFSYDSSGNLLTRTVTDTATSDSRTWSYTHNSFGQVLTVDGPRTDVQDVTTYTYYNCSTGNECGQVATVSNALGQTTTYNTYNAHGQPLTMTDANGVVTTLVYDARRRVTSRTVASETTSFEYWPTGQVKKATLPDGSFVEYTYDNAQRLTEIADAEGNRIVYTLDAMGNRTSENVFDPSNDLSHTGTRVFDSLSRLKQEIRAAGTTDVTTTFDYDANGNNTSIFAPIDRTTTQAYDELDRLTQVTDPANGITQYGYDANDNLTSVTDPRNLQTTYQYNGLGDLTQQVSPDTGITTHTFDQAGNVQTSTDARGRTATYTYDALGRATQVAYSDQTIAYTYDQGVNAVGRLTQVSDASGSTSWTYDPLGRVMTKQQTIASQSFTAAYSYNSAGQLATMTTPSGQMVSYTYANGHVAGIAMNGTSVLGQLLYAPFGGTRGWQWGNGTLAVREYDLDGQLTLLDSAGVSAFTFNPDGTIASRTDDTPSSLILPAGLTTVAVNGASNQITSTSGALTRSYVYDAAGNTLTDGSNTFTYNDAGRMISVSNGTTSSYLYNALGQRVRKSNAAGTTYFVYDEAGHLIGEYDATGALIQEIIWLGDVPVASIRNNTSGTGVGVFYIHTDHLNAPTKMTEPTTNAIVWRWDHDPFGNGAPNEDPDGNGLFVTMNLRFPGQYFDSETGLHYNYFRDYDPATGRYVQSDPIGLRGGINTYAYVRANPLRWIDRFGLDRDPACANPQAGLIYLDAVLKAEEDMREAADNCDEKAYKEAWERWVKAQARYMRYQCARSPDPWTDYANSPPAMPLPRVQTPTSPQPTSPSTNQQSDAPPAPEISPVAPPIPTEPPTL